MKRKSSHLSHRQEKIGIENSVSLNQVIHFIFTRQGLKARHSGVTKDLFPLHATAITTPSLSLLARVDNFKWQHLTSFVSKSRCAPLSYPLLRCMRSTLHLVPSDMYPLVTKCFNYEGNSTAMERIRRFDLPGTEYSTISKCVLDVLSTQGAMSASNLAKYIESNDLVRVRKHSSRGKWSSTESNVTITVNAMFSEARIFHGLADPSEGITETSWRSNTRLYGLCSLDTLSCSTTQVPPKTAPSQDDFEALMQWYFSIYSPASFKDFVWWCGKKVTECRGALHALLDSGIIQEIKVDKMPQTFYILSSLIPQLLACPNEKPASARFLPYEDAMIKAYKETRYRFFPVEDGSSEFLQVDKEVESLVMWKGEALPTVWVDGKIIGKWKWHKDSSSLEISTLTQLSHSSRKYLKEELTILCDMLNLDPVCDVVYRSC